MVDDIYPKICCEREMQSVYNSNKKVQFNNASSSTIRQVTCREYTNTIYKQVKPRLKYHSTELHILRGNSYDSISKVIQGNK